jgi:hypothetical protein
MTLTAESAEIAEKNANPECLVSADSALGGELMREKSLRPLVRAWAFGMTHSLQRVHIRQHVIQLLLR